MLEKAQNDVEAELQKLPPEQRDKLLEQMDGVERAPAKADGAPAKAPAAGGAAVNVPAPQPAAPPLALGPVVENPFLALAHGPDPLPAPAVAVGTALLVCFVAVFLRASL
jgi:hypothetical protein